MINPGAGRHSVKQPAMALVFHLLARPADKCAVNIMARNRGSNRKQMSIGVGQAILPAMAKGDNDEQYSNVMVTLRACCSFVKPAPVAGESGAYGERMSLPEHVCAAIVAI
jgi:hypothetical protein